MDQAHLHLVLNHFPILGTLFGSILLIVGAFKKSRTLQKAALLTLVGVALFTLPAYYTGEAAEHATEHMIGSSHDMLEEHEELAEKGLVVALVLGAVSLVLWFFIHRNRHKDYTKFSWIVVGLSIISFLLMALIGNHGGKIRRPELRGETVIERPHFGDSHHDED